MLYGRFLFILLYSPSFEYSYLVILVVALALAVTLIVSFVFVVDMLMLATSSVHLACKVILAFGVYGLVTLFVKPASLSARVTGFRPIPFKGE